MIYSHYIPDSLAIHATASPIALPTGLGNFLKNLSVFAATPSSSSTSTTTPRRSVLRFVNDNNASVQINLHFHNFDVDFSRDVAVQTLTSPLFGTALYDPEAGGWNSPATSTFISPVNSSWTMGVGPLPALYELPPESFVVMVLEHI